MGGSAAPAVVEIEVTNQVLHATRYSLGGPTSGTARCSFRRRQRRNRRYRVPCNAAAPGPLLVFVQLSTASGSLFGAQPGGRIGTTEGGGSHAEVPVQGVLHPGGHQGRPK